MNKRNPFPPLYRLFFAVVMSLLAPVAWGGITVSKSFSPASIATGSIATLTVTINNNPAPGSTGSISFTDNYPPNLVNATTPSASSSCGGTVTAVAGGSALSFSGGSLSGNNTCTVSVNVTSAVAGFYLNSTGTVITTNAGNGVAATATLTVTGGTPVAEYRFDDVAWCTPVAALDMVGGHNGTLIGGVPWLDSPASGGKPVSGAAAGFSGGAIDITGLPLNLAAGAQNSVSFWMYWDGTNSVMPLGFGSHDLWLQGGSFGFNTFNSDIFGISSAGLAGGWHHVAAVFTNGNVAANKLWIDGVAQVMTQRASTPNNANANASSHLRISGVWGNSGYLFRGRLDAVRVYSGLITQAQVDGDRALTSPAVVCPPPPPPMLAAQYRLDDNWDVTHSAVNDVGGSPAGTFLSTYATKVAAPAVMPNKPNTCSGASFTAATGSMRVTGASLDLAAGGINSISFWMYWNGGNNQMPFGFAVHDLWLQGGSFGFNSGNSDIFGISSAGLANSWHHVAAVFSNGNVAVNKLWIDGVPQTLTQRQGTPNNATAYASNTFQLSSWTNDNNYRFGGTLDELKVYRGALTDALVLADYANSCIPPNPVAEYRMDEVSWSGVSGEVKDSSSNSLNGTAQAGASSATAKVCRGGLFGSQNYAEVPDNSLLRVTTSYTLAGWIKTTKGTGTIVSKTSAGSPWPGHVFALGPNAGGKLALWNGNSWQTSSGAAVNDGTWHHVAASVNGTSLQFYVDGAVNGSAITLSATTSAATTPLRIGFENNPGGAARYFSGQIDELKIWGVALTSGQISAGYTNELAGKNWDGSARTCITAIKPFGFNCVESGADALAGHLYTKLAGAPFNIDVAALRDSNSDGTADGVETTYASDANKNVTVELVDGSGVTACASRAVLSPAVSQTLTFTQAAQPAELGRKAASFTVSKAYPDLRCRVTDANQAPSIVACSTDNFAVRPSAATLNVLPAMATPPSASAVPVIKAGTAFTLTATTSPAASYAGVLALDAVNKLTAQITTQDTVVQNGGVVGVLSPATLTANAALVNNASYAEAGYLYLAPGAFRDDGFTLVDQPNDCVSSTVGDVYLSDAFVGGKIGCSIGNKINYSFGRFIPDHFLLTPGVATPACGTFTYFGQDGFTTAFTLTAQNAANATTQNYSSVFGRLVLSDWNNFGFTAPLLPVGSTLSASAVAPPPNPSGSWLGGVANVVAVHQASKAATPVNPVNLVVNALPVDPDGVTMPAALGTTAATVLRYGRASLRNAHGSNLLDMAMPFRAEYWQDGWRLNAADTCTGDTTLLAGAANAVTVALATVPPAAWATCVWDNSAPGLSGAGCAAAAPAGRQYREGATPALAPPFAGDFNLWLRAPGTGNVGGVIVTPTVPAWLGVVPAARATFGTYNTPVIYRREVY